MRQDLVSKITPHAFGQKKDVVLEPLSSNSLTTLICLAQSAPLRAKRR
ncbi:MAG: hypothetical protein ACJA13_004203, partial [Paraglaciecola sp.]